MNTQTNTQNTYTVEEVATMLLALSGRVDNIEAQLSKKSLKKTAKPKRSAEEIEADKMRKQAAKDAKKLAAAEAKAAKKLAAEQAKAEKLAAKQAKKLAAEQAKAEKKLADEKVKAEKKLAAAQAKAEKLAAKEAKKAAKGPSLDKTYTKKRFNLYRDLKTDDPENQFKGMNDKFLRIAKKKDGSDTTVYRVSPNNWTEEATKHFESLEDKWDRKSLPFSPNYVAPEPKIKPAKKKAPKKKKVAKKTLVEQTAVIDTDDELEEQPPAEYYVHRCFRMSKKSSETTWVRFYNQKIMNQEVKERGLVPLNQWAWMRFPGDDKFNDKTYETNPLAPKVGKNIVKDGKVVGNCCESFNPVTEDDKDAETVGQADDEEELDEIEDDDEDLIPDKLEDDIEYDSDGYREFYNPTYDGEALKITKDNRVFKADGITFLGRYNDATLAITNESSDDSEDDAFGSENDMVDGEVF
tara:strand:- start:5320 stop:6717 length:1398 start_codon:yes stop_codon:yes gene_type:complete